MSQQPSGIKPVKDGKDASLRCRQYFEEVHGTYGVYNFKVIDVGYEKKDDVWSVRCEFAPWMSGTQPPQMLEYDVGVKGSGEVFGVKRVESK